MTEPLVLPAELTIYVAAELRAPWLEWLDAAAGDGAVALVDGHAVEEIDAAGLQCLLALARSLEARQQRLLLTQPSEALGRACHRLGARHLLSESEGAPA
jgi:anti-anti-sigma regulatory factor